MRAFAVDEDGTAARLVVPGVHAALPPAGLGRARRRQRSGRSSQADPRRAVRRDSTSRSRPSASPTSARRSWCGIGAPAEPLHRAIVWQDRRTAERCDELREAGHLDLVRSRTGLVLDPYFSATKLEWLLPTGGVDAGADLAFGTVDSWLLWNLTGRRGARHRPVERQPHDALRHRRARLVRRAVRPVLACPVRCCPRCGRRAARFGHRRSTARGGVPPASRSPASPATSRPRCSARPASSPGMTKNTYGTGSFVLMNVGADLPAPVEGLLTTVAWTLADGTRRLRARGRHLRHRRRRPVAARRPRVIEPTAAEIGPLAESCPTPRASYSCPRSPASAARGGIRTPRGTIVGITRGTGRAHLARAVVEAMAYQTRDVVDAMAARVGHARCSAARRRRRVGDGPAAAAAGRPAQVPVRRARRSQETTALGAAYLAGLAEGVWSSLDEIAAHWQLDRRVHARRRPQPAADQLLRGLEASRRPRPQLAGTSEASRTRPAMSAPARRAPVARGRGTGAPCGRARARDPASGERAPSATSSGPACPAATAADALLPSMNATSHAASGGDPTAWLNVLSRRDARPHTSRRRSRRSHPRTRLRTAPRRRAPRPTARRSRARRAGATRVGSLIERTSSTSTPSTCAISLTSRSTSPASGRATTSSSIARPAPRSRISMPTTSPSHRTDPARDLTECTGTIGQPDAHGVVLHRPPHPTEPAMNGTVTRAAAAANRAVRAR